MKSLIERDKKRRRINKNFEEERLALKTVIFNQNLPKSVRWKASIALSNFPKNSSRTRLTNRCILTGRSKSVHRDFKISRICFRKLGNAGDICGLRKASW